MPSDIEHRGRLVTAALKLRTALNAAFLTLVDVEKCESLEEAHALARRGRTTARETLALRNEALPVLPEK